VKSVQNEKGYVLLLTLVIIFIIIIFFSSFAFSAMNQQKQVEKTDDNYEVTAIAEMGVEYYRAEILNLIKKYADLTLKALELNDTLPKEKRESIDTIKNRYMTKFYDEINTLPLRKEVNPAPQKYFMVKGRNIPNIHNNQLIFEVIGHLSDNNTKEIEVTFSLPIDLIEFKLSNDGGDEESSGSMNGKLVPPPDFTKTIPDPFPPNGTKACSDINGNFNKVTCYTDNLLNFNKFQETTLYYTGTKVNGTVDNENFHNSIIYTKGNFEISNFNKSKDVSFMINGSGKFGTIESNGNVVIQTNNASSFQNINIKKDLNLYINGFATFTTIDSEKNIPDKKEGLILYSKGASFMSINNLENSTFEIEGKTTFNQASSFINSKIHSTGDVIASQLKFSDNSYVYFDKNINQSQAFEVKSSSMVCLKGSYKLGQVAIDKSSFLYILDSSNGTYQLQNSEKNPTFLSQKEFDKVCKIAGGPPIEPSYDYTPIIPKENEIIEKINY